MTHSAFRVLACSTLTYAGIVMAIVWWHGFSSWLHAQGSLVVTVTEPASGSAVGGTVPVTASVQTVGPMTVAGVQFTLDDVNLGAEDTTEPYSISWDTATASNGSHILRAVARDIVGIKWTSDPVAVTVFNDSVPPAIAISAPAGGAQVSGGIPVRANASDNTGVAGVQFKLDGANLAAEDTTAPYEVPWDTRKTPPGTHTLTAVARDIAGLTATSAPVTVTVIAQTSVTRIEEPDAAITYSGDWIRGNTHRPWSGGTAALGFAPGQFATLTFTGTDVSWIGFRGPQAGIARVHLDGIAVADVDAYSPSEEVAGVLFVASGLTEGSHTLAIEPLGVKHASSIDYFGVVDAFDISTADFTPPAVTLTSPPSGATVSAAIAVNATASDNVGVAGVQFRLDGVNLEAEDTSAPFSVPWDTRTTTDGAHALTAAARDAVGNTTTSAAVIVTVDNSSPSVTITAPAAGATVSGTTTVNANAADNISLVGVQFRLDGANLGAEDTAAPYAVPWDTRTASNGSHTLTAVARDAAGNSTTSAAVTVTVANGVTIRLQDGNTAIVYDGAWNLGNTARPWSGGTAAIGFGIGQNATVSFHGTGVSWVGFRGPWAGIANVYVDGTFAAAIDAYATTEAVQSILFTASNLPLGPHTLRVEVTRTKNALSTDYVVVVDAFDIVDAPPDTIPPTVTITSPNGGSTVSGAVSIAASVSDDTGVASVTFFVDGTQLGNPDTISPHSINWTTTAVPDGNHTLTASAADSSGNTTTSSPVTVTVSNAAPPVTASATRIENTDLSIVYTDGCSTCGQPPSWFHGSRSRTWSGGTASFNRADGSRATLTFTGTAVKWIGFRAVWAGIARVSVDGAFVSEIDLYSPVEQVAVPVFQVADLAAGTHTITVESTGRKNAAADDYAVVVDAFDVSPAFAPPVNGARVEETASSVTLTAGWTQGDATQPWSGGTAAVSSTTGDRVTFVFTGTSVAWVGLRAPAMGIARVYLDGAFQADVNTYAATTIQETVYSVSALALAEHRLEVEVTGLSHANATGHAIAVDAFDVRSRLEEQDAAVTYSGAWSFNSTDRNWSGTSLSTGSGTVSRSAVAGASVQVTFTGTAVRWIGFRSPQVGIADVYLDGTFAERIDLYSPSEQVQVPVFSASGLASGTHTLRIEATGLRNPAASTALVMIDAFDVTAATPAPRVTRVQETHSSIAYTSGWTATNPSNLWSGERAREAATVGAQATVTFTGTSVRWLSERGLTTGVARVLLDGQFLALVDTRTPLQEEYSIPLVTVTGLSSGSHTLTIEASGRSGEAAGTPVDRVIIDGFDSW